MSRKKAPAKRKKATSRRGRKKAGGGFAQKLLVGFSGALLVLCAASITSGFFFRHTGVGGEEHPLRIEVLNGTGISGLAHTAKRELLRLGVDVIDAGNADHFGYEESVLIARKEGTDVEEVGRRLGCKHVIEQLRDGTLEDATLILGADYADLRLDWTTESSLKE